MLQTFFKQVFRIKHVLGFGLMLFTVLGVQAQQDAQYTQYMYNTITINPAYAGSRGQLSVTGLHRSQWMGLDGAPKTQTLNAHSPVGYRGLGLGLSVVHDQIGPTNETSFGVDFSYTLELSYTSKLSFGLNATGNLLDIRFSELDQNPNTPDGMLQEDIHNRFSPNFGVGLYYHTDNFYAGLSVPSILETTYFENSSLSTAQQRTTFYFITGYVWEFNPDFKFKPTLLTKAVSGAPLQVDVSANFMLYDRFVLGASYRWDAAVTGLVGFQMSDQIYLGLAYDKDTTELGGATFNDGSFEVILRFELIRSYSNLKSPRFF